MVENLGRKVILIVILLLISVLSMVLPEEPFRLGLDLQGGTRLVYKIDWDEALARGDITQQQYDDKEGLLKETIRILRERVDPTGVKEAGFAAQGSNRFVIEIPSTASVEGAQASGSLTEKIDALQSALTVSASAEMLDLFPVTGGQLLIDSERMGYEERKGNLLMEVRRGIGGTTAASHEANVLVELKGEDPIQSLIENPGSMMFYIHADTADFPPGTDLTTEVSKANTWREENPDADWTVYNKQLAAQTGELANLRFFNHVQADEAGNRVDVGIKPLWRQKPEWTFTGDDLDGVNPTTDRMGYPAVALHLNTAKEFYFSDFTGDNIDRGLAIVLNDVIVSLANIRTTLGADFIIEGQFTPPEVEEMVRVLRSGSLIVKPELEQSERVGAKLGDEFVKRGFYSMLVGLSLVLLFVMGYYRKLGLFAAVSLFCSLVMLMGGMAFLRATLTLPGVAGIILTVGMAVDANILIYERIREELRRGRKLPQACENGFNRALVTIIDANVTTFITAAILYYVGTGPVRGFAITLMIGIVTAVFSALVITRVMVHFTLARGTEKLSMAQVIGETHIPFMKKAKAALAVSCLLITGGVGLFLYLPESQTMSIDFVGGLTVTAQTEEPQLVDTIRERIGGIEGDMGNSDVVALRSSGNAEDGYRAFRITYKAMVDVTKEQEAGTEKGGEDDIRDALADLLQKGPVDARLDGAGAAGRIYFDEPHPAEDIQTLLVENGYGDVTVAPVEGFLGVYEFTASQSAESNEELLGPGIANLFNSKKDSSGGNYRLSTPLPGAQIVGAQVVGELRDSAILAILISLFAIVMYIRVRFAEYSYGFAAVVALVHDVLMTVGALAVANVLGIIEAEITLPMIAAFLTIIGYSLNDTIVVFDRIRENRPRLKMGLDEILDTSINQTLSRTVLTSMTTLVAVVTLFIFNYGVGSVLEGFGFALCFGVIVGTYSSIFVASPALLFFERWRDKRAAAAAAHSS